MTAPTPAGAPLDAHALLIQITQYPSRPLAQVSDADDLAGVLRDPALCGYPPGQVRVLRDHEATRAALLGELRRLVASAGDDATVVFYFSGHGGQIGDATYLMPVDTDPAAIPATALSADQLTRELAPLVARKVLLIFDCCHAGAALAHLALRPGLSPAVQDALLAGRGWALFASSDVDESSYATPGDRNSLFTKHFLAGLSGGRPSDDGYVRVFDVFEYLQPRVVKDQPLQHPVFKCALRDNFAIARYRGGTIGTVARTEDGFAYHALVVYAADDAAFVRTELLPHLRAAGLRVATTNEIVEPGMDRIIGLDRGLEQARRTLVVVTPAYLRRETTADRYADHAVLQRKHADIASGRYSLIPIYRSDPDALADRPTWLASLVGVRLDASADVAPSEEIGRLIAALGRPLPRR